MQLSSPNASDWPGDASERLSTFALDQHMLAYYDSRPAIEVEAFQRWHLSKLLSHADKHSPWWRNRLQSSHAGTSFDSNSLDIKKLPLMSRESFRTFLEAAEGPLPLPRGHGNAGANSTSGTSGIPLSFYTSRMCGRMNGAHGIYDRRRQGIEPSGLFARIALKFDAHDGPHVRFPPNAMYWRNEEFVRRSKQFTIEAHARWLGEIKPSYVFANTSLLQGILDAYEDGTAEPPSTPIQAFLSYAETVTPEFRLQARRLVGARVLDRYSCEEVGPLAYQCPLSDAHYHIASTNALVEVLDEHGAHCQPNKVGRIFVSGLHNYASPIVRYELGDLATWAPRCTCGYDKPVLTNLLGRERFLLRLPSGERQNVVIRARHWLSVSEVREARIVQVSAGAIRAECVLDRPMTARERVDIEEMLRREISPHLTYEVVQLERIDWGPSYKRQDVISLI